MLFPRNALASGPQACFLAGKGITKVKVERSTNFLLKHPECAIK
jgi:hypothetical protein